jgi:uncharacterized protein YlaI
MNSVIIDELLKKTKGESFFESMHDLITNGSDCFNITSWLAGDAVAEAETHLQSSSEPIECDACGNDVRRWNTESFADINLDGHPLRWFRLCEPCAKRLAQDDDERILFLFTIKPNNDEQWRNGFKIGYQLENEPWSGKIA